MPEAENILVRGVNWLGDAVMTTPALMRLRETRPNARITMLTPEKLAGLYLGQSCIDDVIAISPGDTVWKVGRMLRGRSFTTGIAFPNSVRSALELWLAMIPKRIGIGRPLLLTQSLPRRVGAVKMRKRSASEVERRIRDNSSPDVFPAESHHVHDYLHIMSALGASIEPTPPRVEVGANAIEQVREKFGLTRMAGRPWFGLVPGAEYGPAKRWPAERFVEMAVALEKKTNCRWVAFGAAADHELVEKIGKDAGGDILNLAGRTTLQELAAALKICELVVTNDTGPMHLASAVGAPVVAIFGSTSPELTGPVFSNHARIIRQPPPCAPCFLPQCPIDLRCLRNIQSEQLVESAEKIIWNSGTQEKNSRQ
jgi:heptosyltransferase-2